MPGDGKNSNRSQPRIAVSARVQVSWQDPRGMVRVVNGTIRNISRSGFNAALPEPIEARTLMSFACPQLRLQGSGSVRYCKRADTKYAIGCEFAGGLEWKPG